MFNHTHQTAPTQFVEAKQGPVGPNQEVKPWNRTS